MNELFGFTRTVVKPRYALLTPDGFVPGNLPGWKNVVAVVNISPAMGAAFSQWQITFGENAVGEGNTGALEFFIYALEGKCVAKLGGQKYNLAAGGFVFIPPETDFDFGGDTGTRLLIFQKKNEPLAGAKKLGVISGHEKEIPGQPFLGNEDARLQVLLRTSRSSTWR